MFKLAVVPFDCLLVLRDNGDETQYPHSFMAEIHAGTTIHLGGRDWTVVEIHDRGDDVPAVVCRPT
jgi:hypothetical protein